MSDHSDMSIVTTHIKHMMYGGHILNTLVLPLCFHTHIYLHRFLTNCLCPLSDIYLFYLFFSYSNRIIRYKWTCLTWLEHYLCNISPSDITIFFRCPKNEKKIHFPFHSLCKIRFLFFGRPHFQQRFVNWIINEKKCSWKILLHTIQIRENCMTMTVKLFRKVFCKESYLFSTTKSAFQQWKLF